MPAAAVSATVTELPESRVRVEAQVPAEELEKSIDQVARSLGRDMKMPGFRAGKIPSKVVVQRLGREVVLDEAMDSIRAIQDSARADPGKTIPRPRWPMMVLRSPKGWTGPATVDGVVVEGTWRSHQVPLANARDSDEHLAVLADWLQSYRPAELFDDEGAFLSRFDVLRPAGDLRMSANPAANGGLVLKDLIMPDFREFAVEPDADGAGPRQRSDGGAGFHPGWPTRAGGG